MAAMLCSAFGGLRLAAAPRVRGGAARGGGVLAGCVAGLRPASSSSATPIGPLRAPAGPEGARIGGAESGGGAAWGGGWLVATR